MGTKTNKIQIINSESPEFLENVQSLHLQELIDKSSENQKLVFIVINNVENQRFNQLENKMDQVINFDVNSTTE